MEQWRIWSSQSFSALHALMTVGPIYCIYGTIWRGWRGSPVLVNPAVCCPSWDGLDLGMVLLDRINYKGLLPLVLDCWAYFGPDWTVNWSTWPFCLVCFDHITKLVLLNFNLDPFGPPNLDLRPLPLIGHWTDQKTFDWSNLSKLSRACAADLLVWAGVLRKIFLLII